jgi:hypothetical protein
MVRKTVRCELNKYLTDIPSPEVFWVDLVIRNPLDAEVNLSKLTVIMGEAPSHDAEPTKTFVEVDVIDDVVLGARETRTVGVHDKSSILVFFNFTRRFQSQSNRRGLVH